MTPIQTFIDIECKKRELYREYGFKNGTDYYTAREKAYGEVPKDFTAETEDFEISVGQEEHLVKRLRTDAWMLKEGEFIITKPKLIFKRKQPNRRK